MAISLIPLLLFPQLLFGGYVKLFGSLEATGWEHYIANSMPIRWSFESMIIAEYDALISVNSDVRPLKEIIGFSHIEIATPTMVLFGFLFFTLALCLLRLQLTSK